MSGWVRVFPLFGPVLAVAAVQGGVPMVLPLLEARPVIDTEPEDALPGARLGDADEPATWLHPTDPSRSLVAGALRDGGLDVYNLHGEGVQSLGPAGVRYNNVDVLYGFPRAGDATDLFVASDRYRDVLVVFATDPVGPPICTESGEEPGGEATAYGSATYRNPDTNGFHAFVSRETNEVAQLRLWS